MPLQEIWPWIDLMNACSVVTRRNERMTFDTRARDRRYSANKYRRRSPECHWDGAVEYERAWVMDWDWPSVLRDCWARVEHRWSVIFLGQVCYWIRRAVDIAQAPEVCIEREIRLVLVLERCIGRPFSLFVEILIQPWIDLDLLDWYSLSKRQRAINDPSVRLIERLESLTDD